MATAGAASMALLRRLPPGPCGRAGEAVRSIASSRAAARSSTSRAPGRVGRSSGWPRTTSPSSCSCRLAARNICPATPPGGRRPLFQLAAAALRRASPGSDAAGGPSGAQQTLTTARTLPYAAADLFRIIADVDAYAQFLPHCAVSRVTQWRPAGAAAAAAEAGSSGAAVQQWPARADLTVGWGPLSQTYSSRVYCVPGHGVVEAVSGRAGCPTLTASERAELGLADGEPVDGLPRRAPAADDDPFESLVTRWTVVPLEPQAGQLAPRTRVELRVRFQFRNPLYQMAAAQAGGDMVAKMIDAFEARVEALLGDRPPSL